MLMRSVKGEVGWGGTSWPPGLPALHNPICPPTRCRGKIGEVEVAAPLLALAGAADHDVAVQATAALANIALEFSAVKQQLVDALGSFGIMFLGRGEGLWRSDF